MKKQKSKLDIEQICWWIILVCGLIMAFILIYVVIFNPPATLQTLNQTENQTSDNFDYINFLEKVEKDCGSTFLVYRDDEWKVFGNKCLQSYPYYCSVQYTKLKDCLK